MSSQIWPPVVEPSTLTRQVWDSATAMGIPAVARALNLYDGLLGQCELDQYRGPILLTPRPPLLQLPDPNLRALATFTKVHVNDYLVHGNALHLITARYADGWPAAVRWFPAEVWSMDDPDLQPDPGYYVNGIRVPNRDDVVHVQWGAAPGQPYRGWGIVERHMATMNRAGLQEAAESANLAHGGVPSVAVIAPQTQLSQTEVDAAGVSWEEKFQGPGRRPGIFPHGTVVTPLSFSPEASEATEARKMTLIDVANILNLDPYWLGHPGSSHNYKSPGPMFLTLQRTSLEPVMNDLEQVWSLTWLPYGTRIRFDRNQLTRDDFASSIATLLAAVSGGLMTKQEARVYLGWSPEPMIGEFEEPASAVEPGSQPLQLVPGGADDDQEEPA